MIRQQIVLSAVSFAAGIVIVLAYEMLIILREIFRTGRIIQALTDFLFWETAAVTLFYVIYTINGGAIRGYALISLFLGMIFFWCIFGKKLLEMMRKALKKARSWFNIVGSKLKAGLKR